MSEAATAPQDVDRRLAAILATDAVGYSRLAAEDEDAAIRGLAALRAHVEALVAAHRGRVFSVAGDGLLAVFTSLVDAIRCALAIQQRGTAGDDGAVPPLALRAAVHLGEVVLRGGDVLGDAVNVAARLEALAEPGGLCISGSAREHLSGRLPLALTDLGDHRLKNIPQPVRVFRVGGVVRAAPDDAAPPSAGPAVGPPAAVAGTAHPRFSIAVLPFTNMSGDPGQDYLADGIAEEILTALSQVRRLFVIARNSSFTYRGHAVDVKRVGRELGVRYVLEGSVRRAGQRLRIAGQLVDAASGAHLWADRFDGSLDDIFELQDRVTVAVAGAIEPSLLQSEQERARRTPAENLDAYDLWLRALPITYRMIRQDAPEALDLLRRAIELDPRFAPPWALSAYCHAQRLYQAWTDPPGDPAEGMRLAEGAIERGSDDVEVLWRSAFALAWCGGDLRPCHTAVERAVALNPNSAMALAHSGWVQLYGGGYAVAADRFQRARRLSPVDPMMPIMTCGMMAALFFQEAFEEALPWGQEALMQSPHFLTTHRFLAATLVRLGRREEARAVVRQALARNPDLRVASTLRGPFRHTPRLALYVEALRQAGLPE